MAVSSARAKTAGLLSNVDCLFLFMQSMIDAGCEIRRTPNGTFLTQEVVGMEHLQAIVNIDDKRLVALGIMVHTLDFARLCFFS